MLCSRDKRDVKPGGNIKVNGLSFRTSLVVSGSDSALPVQGPRLNPWSRT